jgi:probable HAF family extracellular repeat protein
VFCTPVGAYRPMRSSVLRQAVVPALAFLLCSCSSSDAVSGVNGAPATAGFEPATRSTIAFTRLDIGTLGGPSSYAADLNNRDVVVGWSETATGDTHAFRWSAATGMIDLGTLPGDRHSRAVAILDGESVAGGQVLGVSWDEGHWHSVLWSASGVIRELAIPLLADFTIGFATGFNMRGDVVGYDGVGGEQHAWVSLRSQQKYDLSAIVSSGSNEGYADDVSASGLVLVTARAFTCRRTPECWRTYLWTDTKGYVPLGTPGDDPEADVTGLGLSETGTVVGTVVLDAGASGISAYRWDAKTGFTFLPHYASDGWTYGYATGVNTPGSVVGADREPVSGSIVATMWPVAGGMVRLTPEDPNPSVAIAINDQGAIAGWAAVSSGGNHAMIWSPVSNSSRAIQSAVAPMRRISTASAPCLSGGRAITSRQALFACVLKSDKR